MSPIIVTQTFVVRSRTPMDGLPSRTVANLNKWRLCRYHRRRLFMWDGAPRARRGGDSAHPTAFRSINRLPIRRIPQHRQCSPWFRIPIPDQPHTTIRWGRGHRSKSRPTMLPNVATVGGTFGIDSKLSHPFWATPSIPKSGKQSLD